MIDINKVHLIGRLTDDADLRYAPTTGTAVASFRVAVNRKFLNKNGEREADFFPVVVWGKTAENVCNFTKKGKLIGISGRLQTRHYQDKDGNKRMTTEVIADPDGVEFLEWAKSPQIKNEESYTDPDMTPIEDGEIPF